MDTQGKLVDIQLFPRTKDKTKSGSLPINQWLCSFQHGGNLKKKVIVVLPNAISKIIGSYSRKKGGGKEQHYNPQRSKKMQFI